MSFQEILDSTEYGIIAIDHNKNIFFCNKAFFSLLNIKKKIIDKQPLQQVLRDKKLIQILKTGQPQPSEKFIYNNKIFLIKRIPIKDNDKIVGAICLFNEITNIEKITFEIANSLKNENELNSVIEAINYGILIMNQNGLVNKINNALSRDTELTSSDFLGKSMEILHKEGIIKHVSIALTSMIKKEAHTDFQGICTGKELIINAIPILNQKGEVLTVASTVQDLTVFNKLQLELEDASWLSNFYRTTFNQPIAGIDINKKNFITRNPKMLNILDLAKKIASTQSKILVLGESGVGKELIVEKIHKWSSRKGNLIKINCSAIPEELLESELFGYEEGAFTGARKRGKPGAFEMANNGTIFLDEIGDLPLAMQAKLLRVLEDTKVLRLGGTKPINLNVRIIAATNQNLKKKVEKGEFREDLYYRLNVFPLIIPPIRERTEDIPLLLCFYLNKYNQRYQLQKSFSPAILNILTKYSWPGNVRELKNVVERMVIASNEEVIQEFDIPDYILHETKANETKNKENTTFTDNITNTTFELDYSNMSLKRAKEELEKFILINAINKHGSLRKVSKALGLSHTAIIKKVKNYGLK